MKKSKRINLSRNGLTALLAILLAGVSAQAGGQVPQGLHYQGFLVDVNGNPVSGDWTLTFSLYHEEEGGLAFFEETLTVAPDMGVFSVTLGSAPDSPLAAEELASSPVWLGVQVHGDDGPVELLPRQKVASVPYALMARQSEECTVCSMAMGVGEGVCIAPGQLDVLLAEGGYCTQCYADEKVQAYLDGAAYVAGPHFGGAYDDLSNLPDLSVFASTEMVGANFCPMPCYGDDDVEALLDGKAYCDTCYTDQNVEAVLEGKQYCQTCYSDGDVEAVMAASACLDCTVFLQKDGSTPLQGDWDIDNNQLVNIVVHNAASDQAPVDPVAGQLYWDTDQARLTVFDGQQWTALGKAELGQQVQALQAAVQALEVSVTTAAALLAALETTVLELQAALADHQGQPHLLQDQYDALTGGPEVVADAYHTHKAITGMLENVNSDLLNSVFEETYLAQGLPDVLDELAAESFVIHFPNAGEIAQANVFVQLSHPDVSEITVKLRSPGGTEVLLRDKDAQGTAIQCTFDEDCQCSVDAQCMDSFAGEDPKGDWTLTVLDLVPGNAATLNAFSLSITYMSSETLEVKGDVKSSVGSLSTNLEFILLNMLGSALAGDAPAGQVNLVVNPALEQADSAEFKDAGGKVQFGTILDLHDDAELDGALWTCAKGTGTGCTASASCAESGTSLIVSAMGCGSSGWAEVISAGFDARSFGVNLEVVARVTQSRGAGGGGFGNTHTYAYIADVLHNQFGGSTGVLVDSDAMGTWTYNYLFLHEEEQLRVWRDGVELGNSPFNLAGLASWRLHFKAVASEGSCSWPNKDDSSVAVRYELYRVEGVPGWGQVTTKPATLDVASDKVLAKLIASPDGAQPFVISARTSPEAAFTVVDNMGIGLLDGAGLEGTLRFRRDWTGGLQTDQMNILSHELKYGAYFIWE